MWALAAEEILKLLLAYLVPVAGALQKDWVRKKYTRSVWMGAASYLRFVAMHTLIRVPFGQMPLDIGVQRASQHREQQDKHKQTASSCHLAWRRHGQRLKSDTRN